MEVLDTVLFLNVFIILVSLNHARFLENHVSPLEEIDNLDENGLYSNNQIENSNDKVELDMKLPPFLLNNARKKRAVLTTDSLKWPNAVVPYTYDTVNPIGDGVKKTIVQAFKQISSETCVTFIRRTTENNYITFTKREQGCWSFVGMSGGSQELNLSDRCNVLGTVIHELLHALGFLHEHNRPDRDNYVIVNMTNVMAGAEPSLKKFDLDSYGGVSLSNIDYDKASVMHYHRFAFTKFPPTRQSEVTKERMTIYSKTNSSEILGNRNGMSNLDIIRINKRYTCPSPTTDKPVTVDLVTKPGIVVIATEEKGISSTEEPKNQSTKKVVLTAAITTTNRMVSTEQLTSKPTNKIISTKQLTSKPTNEVISTAQLTSKPTNKIIPTKQLTSKPTNKIISTKQLTSKPTNKVISTEQLTSKPTNEVISTEQLTSKPTNKILSTKQMTSNPTNKIISTKQLTSKPTNEVMSTEQLTSKPTDEVISTEQLTSKPTNKIVSTKQMTSNPTNEVISTEQLTSKPTDKIVPTTTCKPREKKKRKKNNRRKNNRRKNKRRKNKRRKNKRRKNKRRKNRRRKNKKRNFLKNFLHKVKIHIFKPRHWF